ncbi:MAG: hypothetical protein QGG73_01840 [Candidatus Hydrogenedentes bacterium]|nr:hypothetical protein [Candidatus Hydrogenedentota bacterium]
MTCTSKEDVDLFSELDPLLEELWGYLRHLADLKSVWPRLTEKQRSDIDSSAVHRDRFHEKNAERLVEEIRTRASRIRAHRHTPLKNRIIEFLDNWRDQEPDMLKVIQAMMTRGDEKD